MRLLYKYRRLRSKWRRAKRLVFVSPAEIAFIRLAGGHVLNIESIRNWSGCQLVVWYDLGKVLKSWNIERELRAASGVYVDFGTRTPNKKAMEVLSLRWHNNILIEEERRQKLRDLGWEVLYIEALEIRHYPWRVKQKVMNFLSK